jgi:biopolymer transport protein ExbD
MALKRGSKILPTFSMASLTDIIFLLLIFFVIMSTAVSPNSIKVVLPQGKQRTAAKPLSRVIIDKNLNYFVAFRSAKEKQVPLASLPLFLKQCAVEDPDMYVALFADESVPYREVVRVLEIANSNHYKMVLATRPPKNHE